MSDREARQLLIAALGMQSSFWGLGRITGELYAVLYTAPAPLCLAELAAELGVTKGNVSVAIRRLEELGMVQRRFERGDRRVFFSPNTDFWDIGHQFLQRRHQPAFAASFHLLAESLEKAETTGSPHLAERVRVLKDFYDRLDEFTALLLALDSARLAQLSQLLAEQLSALSLLPDESGGPR